MHTEDGYPEISISAQLKFAVDVLLRTQSRKLGELASFPPSQWAQTRNVFLLHSLWSPRPSVVVETSLTCSFLPVINALASSHIYSVVKFLFFLFPDSPPGPASNHSSSHFDSTVTAFWITYHIQTQGCPAASSSRQRLNSVLSSTFLKKANHILYSGSFSHQPVTRHHPLLPLFLH